VLNRRFAAASAKRRRLWFALFAALASRHRPRNPSARSPLLAWREASPRHGAAQHLTHDGRSYERQLELERLHRVRSRLVAAREDAPQPISPSSAPHVFRGRQTSAAIRCSRADRASAPPACYCRATGGRGRSRARGLDEPKIWQGERSGEGVVCAWS
jgi:hypothetical protein